MKKQPGVPKFEDLMKELEKKQRIKHRTKWEEDLDRNPWKELKGAMMKIYINPGYTAEE